jgi:hypothetical protein
MHAQTTAAGSALGLTSIIATLALLVVLYIGLLPRDLALALLHVAMSGCMFGAALTAERRALRIGSLLIAFVMLATALTFAVYYLRS